MEGEGKKRKNGIELDWGRLLGEEEEEEPPLPVVVENPQSAVALGAVAVAVAMESDEEQSQRCSNFKNMKDKELVAALESSKSTLRHTNAKLKDGGVRLRNQIKLYEDELERRKSLPVRKDDDGCHEPIQSRKQNCFNISDDFQEGDPTSLPSTGSSEFGSRFYSKMDQKDGFFNLKRCDSGNLRFNGILSRGRKKRGVFSRETPFVSPGSLFVDVDRQTPLSNIEKKDGYLAACSPHNPPEDLPSLSTMKRTSASRVQTSRQLRHKGEPVVLDDEDEIEVKEITPHAIVNDECADKETRIYFPSRDDPEAIEICFTDMQCLDPEAYLSSTIMNFYIWYLWGQMPTDQKIYNYHFFNTYFYEKLKEAVQQGKFKLQKEEKRFLLAKVQIFRGALFSHFEYIGDQSSKETSFTKFRRWWKGVNIFEKAYILLPIHEDLHWSLVVICIPDKEDRLGPTLLHLDSLGLHCSESIFNNIKRFLIGEWEYLNEREVQRDLPLQDAVWEKLPRRIQLKVLEVPRQGNDYDCGLFVLYFMKRFIQEAPERLKMGDPSNILHKIGKKWFSPLEPSVLRLEIRAILKEQFKDASK